MFGHIGRRGRRKRRVLELKKWHWKRKFEEEMTYFYLIPAWDVTFRLQILVVLCCSFFSEHIAKIFRAP
jgi:hypothetical protein